MRRFGLLALSILTISLLPLSAHAQTQKGCNPYIYGMHDYNSTVQSLLTHGGEPRGWVLILQSLDGYTGGLNSEVVNAANAGLGVVVRLHWGYGTTGTLPPQSQYSTYASRAANFITTHIDYCLFYSIANEPNLCAEWPAGGAADGGCDPNCTSIREQITSARYASAFQQVYNALSPSVQSRAKLLLAPTGVWAGNFNCAAHGFEVFDFLCYLREILALIPEHMIGGFTFHPKTHTHSVSEITSTALSSPSFGCGQNERVHWYFKVYEDLMDEIPVNQRDKPVFFKELNPHDGGGWQNQDNGYVVAAYNEINAWNAAHPDRLITAMMLYRWDDGNDIWDIHSRPLVQQDLQNAVALGQTANGAGFCTPPATPTPTVPPPSCTGGLWCDQFDDGVIDSSSPEPWWTLLMANGFGLAESGGQLRLNGASGQFSNGGVRNNTNYADLSIHAKLVFENISPAPGGTNESNAEIRFRMDPSTLVGYALTFHAGTDAGADRITLRRSDTFSVYQSTPHSFTSGEVLYVSINANGSSLNIQVGTSPGGANVVNWSLANGDFGSGRVLLYNYLMTTLTFDYVLVGPAGWDPFTTATPTPTPIPTSTPTRTPSPLPTATPTPSPTAAPTATPTLDPASVPRDVWMTR